MRLYEISSSLVPPGSTIVLTTWVNFAYIHTAIPKDAGSGKSVLNFDCPVIQFPSILMISKQ